ncbi:MAG TPA: hypothetical protein VGQ41_21055 [Pyrinomonadaceae bacterium]|jgi:hypothetical protein|nr:hypothetical protein [Pyrinomonadaceae bacterium]
MGDDDKKIPIGSFTGGEDGQNLIGCYFKPKPDDTYNFHDKDDKVKARDIHVGSEFTFELDEVPGVTWHLTLGSNADEVLKGNWWDGRDPSLADGSYQAEAGGSGEEEEPNAASAGGCAA